MMIRKIIYFLLLTSTLVFSSHTIAVIDTNPTNAAKVNTINLRKDCTDIVNCVTTMAEVLTWTWTTRNPTADFPLLVDIGTGKFIVPSQEVCDNRGHVSFRGAGRDNTILTGGGVITSPTGKSVIKIINCTNMSFQNLTIQTDSWRGITDSSVNGITWIDGGSSTWMDVLVQAGVYAWDDACTGSNPRGTHYWFGSKVEAKSSVGNGVNQPYLFAYNSFCGDNWFYGGEISAVNDGGFPIIGLTAVRASGAQALIHIFGSAVRAQSTSGATTVTDTSFQGYGGLIVENGGEIHMHGGIVSVSAQNGTVNQDAYGVRSGSGGHTGGFIHTPDTAFAVKPGGTGIAYRILLTNGTNVQSPFQWPPSSEPPSILSTQGSDTFVETDCSSDGTCAGGNEPHMMIYSASCNTAGPWFDSSRGKCRGVP